MEESVNEHYRQLLRLPKPWKVTAVEKDLEREKVSVCVRWPEQATVACPQCGKKCGIYDRMAERAWRHLSVMQYTLEVKCAVPRCDCPEHGVKTIAVPWAEPGSRFTVHFEAYAVAVIEACRSLTQAADWLRLHWDSVQRIIERAVERGLARRTTEGIRRVGLDEKSFRRGQRYISLMTDLNKQRVLEVVPGRDTKQAVALWQTLPDEQRKTVEAAAMDMGANFVAAKRQARARKLRAALQQVGDWCQRNRHRPLREQHVELSAKVRGHYAFYGIRGNSRALTSFWHGVKRKWHYWLLRRSRKRTGGERLWKIINDYFRLPRPRIVHTAPVAQLTWCFTSLRNLLRMKNRMR